jgi:cytochrome c
MPGKYRIGSRPCFIYGCALLLSFWCLAACHKKEARYKPKKKDYIRAIPGKSDSIPLAVAQQGEVLIAYSDCYTCHKEDKQSVGPAFTDIAKRYPVQQPFIDLLAYKVISGGSGSWGSAVMSAHPKVSEQDAKIMVAYILSLKEW